MNRVKQLVLLYCMVIPLLSQAQELNCLVEVNAEQIQGTETRIYNTMKQAIYNLMNGTKWTTEVFKQDEKIECQILLILESRDNNIFTGSIQVTSRRPVYMSSYHSTVFRHKDDDVTFTYTEFDPIEFNLNTYLNNLSSVLGFYAYMIIGLDYDSFESQGGSKYLDYAQKIVGNSQSANVPGWTVANTEKNRGIMAQNFNDNFFAPVRECIYNYHRNGLDMMYKDVEGGRKAITDALLTLQKVHESRPSSFCMQIFFNAKVDEIVQIYSEAPAAEKNQISQLCKTLDPGHSKDYDGILQAN